MKWLAVNKTDQQIANFCSKNAGSGFSLPVIFCLLLQLPIDDIKKLIDIRTPFIAIILYYFRICYFNIKIGLFNLIMINNHFFS